MTVRPAKTQISPAQSDQSSLCAQWVAKDPSFVHADSDIDIDIEILFFVEYCTTWNISPVGLLFRQTRVN